MDIKSAFESCLAVLYPGVSDLGIVDKSNQRFYTHLVRVTIINSL